jgi:hypothetical protein
MPALSGMGRKATLGLDVAGRKVVLERAEPGRRLVLELDRLGREVMLMRLLKLVLRVDGSGQREVLVLDGSG